MTERDLAAVRAAEARLLATLDTMNDASLAEPSLLPGWTRGHVLAHVALNAHSLVNLFEWARTGIRTPQYPSWEERDADIERRAGRTVQEHRAALTAAGDAFDAAARAVPPDRWPYEVSGIGGDPVPAERFLFGRLREVEIHHVDLGAGYSPEDWDDDFVRRVLDEVPGRMGPKMKRPLTVNATDLGTSLTVGEGGPASEVEGPGAALLAWLLGRSGGSELTAAGPLPDLPSWG